MDFSPHSYWFKAEIDVANIVLNTFNESNLKLDSQKIENKTILGINNLRRHKLSFFDSMMHSFGLNSKEGLALMCLAEAIIRIPDQKTAFELIIDQIEGKNFKQHNSKTKIVKLTQIALDTTISIFNSKWDEKWSSIIIKLMRKIGKKGILIFTQKIIHQLGDHFVLGENMHQAFVKKKKYTDSYNFSFDLLGESARTFEDADKYYNSYENALHFLGERSLNQPINQKDSISVKLSALHPRYEVFNEKDVKEQLYIKIKSLCLLAKKYDIGLSIDAEELNRLELYYNLFVNLYLDPELKNWDGLGFVLQCYQKGSLPLLNLLIELTQTHKRNINLRLVKGAYWDTEIKMAQIDGINNYPVFTHKSHTDLNYLTCAKLVLLKADYIYPQFATHNLHTIFLIEEISRQLGNKKNFEFQGLHGMCKNIYDEALLHLDNKSKIRVYAPIGSHKVLLAYLVRRLLENGANSSFLNQLHNLNNKNTNLTQSPFVLKNNKKIPLPINIFNNRLNSKTLFVDKINFRKEWEVFCNSLEKFLKSESLIAKHKVSEFNETFGRAVINPNDKKIIGMQYYTKIESLDEIAFLSQKAFKIWNDLLPQEKSDLLNKFASCIEENFLYGVYLIVKEGGKTTKNAISDLREAIDFVRYYASLMLENENKPRGVVACISPWNFPSAIFLGQVVASLATGNAVIAKPAEQTPLTAQFLYDCFCTINFPENLFQIVFGDSHIGENLISNKNIDMVCFTGSNSAALSIRNNLNERDSTIPLIAETGGLNAMIVDSSALIEQVVIDSATSAFDSAGQRCSALRMLYIQEDIYESFLEMLIGYSKTLKIGDTSFIENDIGAIIDSEAQINILSYIEKNKNKIIYQSETPDIEGFYVPITIIEVSSIKDVEKEIFGPVLHIAKYSKKNINKVISDINDKGFGLTLGIHSRIDSFVEFISNEIDAGNIYVNRNQIGAVVGLQPFGGHNLSGTGPKAGGPIYLEAFVKKDFKWNNGDDSKSNSETFQLISNKSKLINEFNWQRKDKPKCNENYNYQFLQNLNNLNLSDLEKKTLNELIVNLNLDKKYSLYCKGVNLKGYTGEYNSYKFHPKGLVWIDCDDKLKSLFLAYQFRFFGNTVFLRGNPNDYLYLKDKKIIVFPEKEDYTFFLNRCYFDVYWCSSNKLNDYKIYNLQDYASNKRIVPVLNQEIVPIYCMIREKHIANNITAKGGNVGLLTQE